MITTRKRISIFLNRYVHDFVKHPTNIYYIHYFLALARIKQACKINNISYIDLLKSYDIDITNMDLMNDKNIPIILNFEKKLYRHVIDFLLKKKLINLANPS